MRVPRCFAAALAALPLAGPVQAADSKADRIAGQLAAGKPEAAWRTCEKLMEKGALQDKAEVEACAEADLQRQRLLYPGGMPLEQLTAHWARWGGTAASQVTRAETAKLRLAAAKGDPEMLAAIWGQFSDTPAGQAASDLLYQHYVDQGSSQAMADFAQRFPDAPQASKARAAADDLLWRETEALGTAAAWVAFIKQHPTHPRLAEAAQWHQTLAFRETEAEGSAAGWARFLAEFPHHPRYEEAEQNRVNALFTECEAKGPEAMLAVAEAWPDHPKAALTRARAHARLLQVQLLSRGYADPAWSPRADGEGPPVALPLGTDGLAVTFPAGQPVGTVALAWVEAGQATPLSARYAEHLAAQGFPADRVRGLTQPAWLAPQGQKLVGRLAEPLCQPDGVPGSFAVVVGVFGQELSFPFTVGLACSRARP